jgi:hypothetical protein
MQHSTIARNDLDLLKVGPIGRFLRSRFYPAVFQFLFLFFFVFAIYQAFRGSRLASENFATVTMWSLWWPLLPFSFLFFGRIWCAVCPLPKAGDAVQQLLGKQKKPGPFLRRRGIWIMAALFVLLTWLDRISSFAASPRATGTLLILLVLGAALTMALYRRRTWCRYLCPLGGLSGIYSTTACMELRPQKDTCVGGCRSKACLNPDRTQQECPLFERPPLLASNRNCNFCGNCLKGCRHHALAWRLRSPLRELMRLPERLPGEAFLAVVMVILVYIQTISMAKLFPRYMKWFIEGSFIKSYYIAFSINFAAMFILGLIGFTLAVYLSSRYSGEPLSRNFSTFGYILIPLGLAGHLAHNLFHLVKEGLQALRVTLSLLGVALDRGATLAAHNVEGDDPVIKVIQIIIVLLGALGSFLILAKINGLEESTIYNNRWGRIVPHLIFVGLVAGLFVHLFVLPMNPRHFH